MKPLASLTFPGPSALEHPDGGGNQPVAAISDLTGFELGETDLNDVEESERRALMIISSSHRTIGKRRGDRCSAAIAPCLATLGIRNRSGRFLGDARVDLIFSRRLFTTF
jgi:hypothetical protein